MKKLVVILVSLGLAFGAYAQKGRGPVRNHRPAQKVVIVRSYPPFSPYFGYGRSYFGYGYSPFGFSPYGFDNGHRQQNRPTKLDMQVEDIKNDYQDRIRSVRLDDGLSRKEKRHKIAELKETRDKEVNDVRRNYYKSDSRV